MKPLRAVLALVALAVVVAVIGIGMGGPPKSEDAAPTGNALTASKHRLSGGSAMVTQGGREFDTEGCDTCHAIAATGAHGNLGPRLDTITDDAVKDVVENIVKPRKDIAKGYEANLMPTDYASRMSTSEVKAVATFIKAASGNKAKGGG